MPTVDFTLEDVAKLIKESAESTQQDLKQYISEQFLSFWEDNMAPAFDEVFERLDKVEDRVTLVETDVRDIKRSLRAASR